MLAASFSKESCENSSQAFQKAQTGGDVNTCVGIHYLPQHKFSGQVALLPPNLTIFAFKQSHNIPIKAGDEEGKYQR